MPLHHWLLLASGALPAFAGVHPLLEPNRGQFGGAVLYGVDSGGAFTGLTSSGLEFRRGREDMKLEFAGASLSRCSPASPARSRTNYLNLQPAISGVPAYDSVACSGIYSGIDWVLHFDGSELEHDWRVSAHGDPALIRIRIPAQTRAEIHSDGALALSFGGSTILWRKPIAFQQTVARRRPVEVSYRIEAGIIRLDVAKWRHDLPLLIDPVIDFSYMIAGEADERAYQVALDSAGNIYLAGLSISPDFVTSPGAADSTFPQYPGMYYNAWVRKLSPDASQLIYSTYVSLAEPPSSYNGPPGHPIAMRVDAAGDVYVAANIGNNSMPTSTTVFTPNGYLGLYKLSPDGTHFLYTARMFPVTDGGYNSPIALAIDAAGDAYVASGNAHANVAKIDPSGTKQIFLSATPIDGNVADIALGPDGSIYVAGVTAQGFTATQGAFQPSIVNPQDQHGFLIRIKPDGSGLVFATWIGGQDIDYVSSMVVDSAGNAILGGETSRIQNSRDYRARCLGFRSRPRRLLLPLSS